MEERMAASTGSSAARQRCPICYDDQEDDGSRWPVLPCGHACCRPCLKQWFATEETTGQEAPTCPLEMCRKPVEDATDILGRAFVAAGSQNPNNKKRKRPSSSDASTADETLDESTKAWLEENTLECGGCQGRLMKASGCDKLQCICGYRICWKCREVGAKCNCNPGHGFVDPVTQMPSWSGATIATPDELRDIKQFLEKRRQERPQHPFLDFFGPSSEFRRRSSARFFASLEQMDGQQQQQPHPFGIPPIPPAGYYSWRTPALHPQPSTMATSGTEAQRRPYEPSTPGFLSGVPFQPRDHHHRGDAVPPSTLFQHWRPPAAIQRVDADSRASPATLQPTLTPTFTGNRPPRTEVGLPNPLRDPPASLARLVEDGHLLRNPNPFLRDLPDMFRGDKDHADLQTVLRMSLMEQVQHMAFSAPRFHGFQSQQQQQGQMIGSTAARPIRVDDEATNGTNRDNRAEPSSRAREVSARRPRDEEFQNDMEEAIRLSLLESTEGPYQIRDAASSGSTSSNPVWLDDDENASEDDAMDRKPAAVMVRPVSTENEEIM